MHKNQATLRHVDTWECAYRFYTRVIYIYTQGLWFRERHTERINGRKRTRMAMPILRWRPKRFFFIFLFFFFAFISSIYMFIYVCIALSLGFDIFHKTMIVWRWRWTTNDLTICRGKTRTRKLNRTKWITRRRRREKKKQNYYHYYDSIIFK